jgi:thiol-disulfide isomerase/thioredoxin
MKSKPTLIALGIVLVIGGAFAYIYAADSNTDKPPTSASSDAASTTPSQATTTSTPGSYSDYTADSIASTTGTKVLFFHAPWCPQCRQLDTSIKAGQIPENVTILKVDYDSNQELRKKYGVTIQTTLVRVDDSGKLVKKYVAYDDPTLQAITPNILQ